MSSRLTVRARARSVRHALSGTWLLLRTQPNAWIHAAATALVIAMGAAFSVTALEWACLVVAITIVWTAEGVNTAIEFLGDATSPELHPLVGRAKDVAAGAVLIAAAGALVVGLLVLGPYLVDAF